MFLCIFYPHCVAFQGRIMNTVPGSAARGVYTSFT